MNRSPSYLAHLILAACLVFLWLMRWDSLALPYFWDEMGVYGKGVQYLLEHGIGLMPDALPPEISRGHPILFYAFHATCLKIFGNSFVVSHTLSLLISSGTLLSTYYLAKELLPPLVAAGCVVLLVCQNIFLAQSTLLIPEMSIALLSTLALLSFLKKKYFISVLLLCIGVLIKESVILIAAFLGLVYLIQSLKAKKLAENLSSLALFTLPLLILLVFLQIQKLQHGWYFFPYHTALVQEGALVGFTENLNTHFKFIFFKQGRNQWLIAGILSLISLAFTRNYKRLFFLQSFITVNLLVFALAFYMDRYLLYLYPVLVILIGQGLYLISTQKKSIAFLLLYVLAAVSFMELRDPSFRYDVSLAYEDVITVHQKAVNAMCEQADGAFSSYSNFPINMSLEDAKLGYIDPACAARISSVPDENNADFIILYKGIVAVDEGNSAIQLFQKGDAEIQLYQRKN